MHPLAVALLTLALIAGPLAAEGQPAGRVCRIGVLLSGGTAPNPTGPNPRLLEFDAFILRMHELGHVFGQNLAIDTRGTEGKHDRLPGLVSELIVLQVDLIFAPATPAARAAKSATSTIPVVRCSPECVRTAVWMRRLRELR